MLSPVAVSQGPDRAAGPVQQRFSPYAFNGGYGPGRRALCLPRTPSGLDSPGPLTPRNPDP